MKKQLITVGILIILIIVGLSGCFESDVGSQESTTGKLLYSIGKWSGDFLGNHVDFKGDYVAWIQNENEGSGEVQYFYILDISNPDSPTLLKKEKVESNNPSGPLVMTNDVIWRDNDVFYRYNISKNEKQTFDLENTALGIPHHLVTSYSGFIRVYNLSDGSKIEIIAPSIYLSLNEKYLVWAERENYIDFDQRINYSIWLYNRNTGDKKKILENITHNNQNRASLCISNDSIIYNDGTKLNMYNVITEELSTLIEHSRKETSNVIGEELYLSNIRTDNDYIIYTELSNEWEEEAGVVQVYSYWCVNILTGEKKELELAHRIYEKKVIGITKTSNRNDKLYIIDLEQLFI